jgi:hypothetical protein
VSEVGPNFGAKFEGRIARSHKIMVFHGMYMYISLLWVRFYRFLTSPGAQNIKCPGDRVSTVAATVVVECSLTLTISPVLAKSLCQVNMDSGSDLNWLSDPGWRRHLATLSKAWIKPLPPGKADLIPVEILSEIFLLIVQDASAYRRQLTLVCRRWHAIILSTPGIHSQLTIRRATQKEVVQAFIQGRKSRLDVRIDTNDEKDGSDFNAETFHACFMAAAQAASRWSSLRLISPPPCGEYKAVQILQPLVHLKSFELARGFGALLEPPMTAICGCASPNLSTMSLADPAAVPYLVQPAGLHLTRNLTTLHIQLSKRMDSPVDILPHLYRVQVFAARNLCLPFYPPDTSLPLTHTLRFLLLQSVSVQWMAGHVFPALARCHLIFPHHAGIIQARQRVTMPSCSNFLYHSNDLHPLAQFHLPSLKDLDVKSGQWNVWRGNLQLAALCPVAAARANSLIILSLNIECSEQLLVYMLRLVPGLQQLSLGLTRPNTLSKTFFQAFIIRGPNAGGASYMAGPPSQASASLCISLRTLQLSYRRSLRYPDKKVLVETFGDILASRNLGVNSPFNIGLSFDGKIGMSHWSIRRPVRESQELGGGEITLGISVPHGILPISASFLKKNVVALPFKEAEYLYLQGYQVEFRFTRDQMGAMVYGHDRPPLSTSLPCAFPLFDTLRVLVVNGANPSFLADHTFPKLERCRVVSRNYFGAPQSLFTETAMPACTRVDIDDPHLLAIFKLPQIHELALGLSNPDCSTIWEKCIAVNANLSGLTLLHIKICPAGGDLIPILRSLTLLETLIICFRRGVAPIFRAFLPMHASGTSGLKQTSGEGQTLALLCPRLQSLRIEGQGPLLNPALISVLKGIVTLRAEFGSPLKNFTFSQFWPKPGRLFKLVGTNGSFTMERIDLPDEATGFELDI